MRTVTIEKVGNNYSVNPNASGGGGTTMTFYAWQEQTRDTGEVSYNISRGNQDDPTDIHNQGIMYFDFDTSPETLEDFLNSHVLYHGGVYTFGDYYALTCRNAAENIYNFERTSNTLTKFDCYWIAPRYGMSMQIERYPSVDNIVCNMSEATADSMVTVYGYNPGHGMSDESSVWGDSTYYLFINEDGSIATADDFSNVKMIIRGGNIGGNQTMYYKGDMPDFYCAEKYEFTDITVDGSSIVISVAESSDITISDNPTYISIIQLMMQGYYGG